MTDEKVDKYLRELESADLNKFEILQTIRSEVKDVIPAIDERMMYGGIMFSAENKDLGGIFVSKNHLSFEFTSGYKMDDPGGFLEGTGKFRRHIKIKEDSDITGKDLKFFIEQMKQIQ